MEHREENAEAVLEPDLPICDPHHHLWNIPGRRYLLDEFLRDTSGGHLIESTVYVECGSYYRANGPNICVQSARSSSPTARPLWPPADGTARRGSPQG